MAEVTSGNNTVLVLNQSETDALSEVLHRFSAQGYTIPLHRKTNDAVIDLVMDLHDVYEGLGVEVSE